ncbi:AzlD domain-containing protein [Virgisporangium aurantiacum]|uniref:Branched-chain amino acid transporter n=1 Tax=Virgisporangium aurantiacum TaxID=175570 RepID=A0A8J3Z9P8_9ACTN|nr:AzlD domain-containing protein [Virgisporangium aurantiacum]GIJ59971.1 branched-chain amino acid transporter [Virgisporangium aurantiacum]
MTWLAIAALAAGTYGLRIAGPLLRSRLRLPAVVQTYLSHSAVALLAALIATAALFVGSEFAGWARPAGVLAGALAAWRRLPFVVVVVGAAVTTALLRLAGVP